MIEISDVARGGALRVQSLAQFINFSPLDHCGNKMLELD